MNNLDEKVAEQRRKLSYFITDLAKYGALEMRDALLLKSLDESLLALQDVLGIPNAKKPVFATKGEIESLAMRNIRRGYDSALEDARQAISNRIEGE